MYICASLISSYQKETRLNLFLVNTQLLISPVSAIPFPFLQLENGLQIVGFGAEEEGLRGSKAFVASLSASQPPILAKASFFALMVMPSATANMSRTMSFTLRSACPGSRHLMNQAFSAKRQPSMISGLPWRCAISAAARMLARLTG